MWVLCTCAPGERLTNDGQYRGEKRCQEPLFQLEGQTVKVVHLGTFFEIHGFFVMSGKDVLLHVCGLLAKFANTLKEGANGTHL